MLRGVFWVFTLLSAVLRAQSLLPANLAASLRVTGAATVVQVPSAGPGFTNAFQIATPLPGRRSEDASLSWASAAGVNSGDLLTLTFWVRKTAPNDLYNLRAAVRLVAERPVGVHEARPSPKSDDQETLLDTVFPCNLSLWSKYSFPVVAPHAYDPEALRLVFVHGLGPQTYEIGGIQLIDSGAQPKPVVPVGSSMIPADIIHTYTSFFDPLAGGGSATIVPATGQDFSKAIHIEVNGTSSDFSKAQLAWVTTAPVSKNDTLMLTFYARLLQGANNGPLQAEMVFERNGPPFERSLSETLPIPSSDWVLLQVPFQANLDFAPGGAHLNFQFAVGPQRFEIAALTLLNYGQVADQWSIPQKTPTDPAYDQLLSDAKQRIPAVRQTPVTVKVTDANGLPVPGAEVRIQQLRHAFRFGSALDAAGIVQPGQDNDVYRSRVASHFTTSVLGSDLKWRIWECTACAPQYDQPQTRQAIQWLFDYRIPLRGHNLIWPSFGNMPDDVKGLTGENLRSRINGHFVNELTDPGVSGKEFQWDVLNEPFDNYDVQGHIGGVPGVPQSDGLLGNNEMISWYSQARTLAPNAQLFLNNFGNIEEQYVTPREDYFYAVLDWMQRNHTALDGIGLQAHFSAPNTLTRVQAAIDRFAHFGLPLAITEFDFSTTDEAAQAALAQDFMTLVFSRPEFSDFLMWGFWAEADWLPDAPMYAADWTSKPFALVYNHLLFQEWWTNALGLTGNDGTYTARVYKGDYQVTVIGPSGPSTQIVTLNQPGVVAVSLPRH